MAKNLRYKGPIYRPPSEADSLLIQATIGCPHNRCTFCMIYKNGPRFSVRDVAEIKEDILTASDIFARKVRTIFLPAGNTIAMKTDDLCQILTFASKVFPGLERITVYGSSQYIHKKGPQGLKRLADAGIGQKGVLCKGLGSTHKNVNHFLASLSLRRRKKEVVPPGGGTILGGC